MSNSNGILLGKKQTDTKCYWRIKTGNTITGYDGFTIECSQTDLPSFKVLKHLLLQLKDLTSRDKKEKIEAQLKLIDRHIPGQSKSSEEQSSFFANAVTYAIMRRISRESVYTSSIIDTSAKLINELFADLNYKRIVLSSTEYCDRPSLKVFVRCILLENRTGIEWHWEFEDDVLETPDAKDSFSLCRYSFFSKIIQLVIPEKIDLTVTGKYRLPVLSQEPSIYSVSSELVLQNYDQCLLICEHFIQSGKKEWICQGKRLKGLALINIGNTEDSLRSFAAAEQLADNPCMKAHLCYLQGLTAAKRTYSLSISDDYYERGINYIKDMDTSEAALERAWLFNGMAMNQTIKIKKAVKKTTDDYSNIFKLLLSAFDLVKEGLDPARRYLRFNLLANLAFLMEIQREFRVSIDIFNKTFSQDLYESARDKTNWNIVLGYRLGLLHFKNDNPDKAIEIFSDIIVNIDSIRQNNWALAEKILRAWGFIMYHTGNTDKTEKIFQKGLDIAIEERSAEAAVYHINGLLKTYVVLKTYDKIDGLLNVIHENRVPINEKLFEANDPSIIPLEFPSPKLPAYIPEIDLEDIPAININQYLGVPEENDCESKTFKWKT